MTERTYSEEEVKRLIKKASELEAERREKSGGIKAEEGLTLEEVASAASEAGIDPELIRKAATEMESPADSDKMTGGEGTSDKEIFAERWLNHIPGQEAVDAIIADLNHRYREGAEEEWWEGGKPKVKKTGRTIEWTHTDSWEIYERRVLLQPHGSRFRIRVSKRLTRGGSWRNDVSDMVQYLPYLLAIGIIFAGYMLDSFLAGIALAAVLSAISYPVLKKYNQLSIDKHKSEIAEIADEVTGQLRMMSESKPGKRSHEKFGEDAGVIDIPEDESGGKEKSNQQKNRLRNG